jgi:hypothetical protein
MIDLRKHKGKRYSKAQLKMGIPIEMEHTKSRTKARRVAQQHLVEFDGYYTALVAMEKRLKAKKKKR